MDQSQLMRVEASLRFGLQSFETNAQPGPRGLTGAQAFGRLSQDCSEATWKGEQLTEAWGDEVTVVMHHVPESEDYEGGYEATSMTGVPYNVIVTGSDRDSVEAAIGQLVNGLRAFGFTGRVTVEDFTEPGRVERYEIEATR